MALLSGTTWWLSVVAAGELLWSFACGGFSFASCSGEYAKNGDATAVAGHTPRAKSWKMPMAAVCCLNGIDCVEITGIDMQVICLDLAVTG